MLTMSICILLEVTIFVLIYAIYIWRKEKEAGILVEGILEDVNTLSGRPTRYLIKVKFCFEGKEKEASIVTSDKGARRYQVGSKIKIIYLERKDRAYWIKSRGEDVLVIIILSIAAVILLFCIVVIVIHLHG